MNPTLQAVQRPFSAMLSLLNVGLSRLKIGSLSWNSNDLSPILKYLVSSISIANILSVPDYPTDDPPPPPASSSSGPVPLSRLSYYEVSLLAPYSKALSKRSSFVRRFDKPCKAICCCAMDSKSDISYQIIPLTCLILGVKDLDARVEA